MQTIRPSADLVRSTGIFQRPEKDSTGALQTIYHTRAGSAPAFVGGSTANAILGAASPVSGTFVESAPKPLGAVISVETGNPSPTPPNTYNHIMSFWATKSAATGLIAITMELRQGLSNETDDLGTFIARLEASDVTTTETKYRKRLTLAEAALITDYTDLQFRFTMRGYGGVQTARILQAELQLPSDESTKHAALTQSEIEQTQRGVPLT